MRGSRPRRGPDHAACSTSYARLWTSRCTPNWILPTGSFRMPCTAKRVSHEGHRLREFLRFRKAPTAPSSRRSTRCITPCRLSSTTHDDRFADQKWMIYDQPAQLRLLLRPWRASGEIVLEDHDFMTAAGSTRATWPGTRIVTAAVENILHSLSIKERRNPNCNGSICPAAMEIYDRKSNDVLVGR